MAVTIKIDASQFARLDAKMRTLQKGRILKDAGDFLRDELKKEPTKSPGAFTRLATQKQKRAFWAKVRAGQARVDGQGYVRTHTTAGGWTSMLKGGFTVVVENATEGAVWVYGERSQQPFHAASKWPRLDRFAKSKEKEVNKIIEQKVTKILGGL